MPPPQEVRFAKSRRPQLQAEAQSLLNALVRFKGELWRVVESSLSAGSDMTTVLCITRLDGKATEWVPLPLVEVLEKAPPPQPHPQPQSQPLQWVEQDHYPGQPDMTRSGPGQPWKKARRPSLHDEYSAAEGMSHYPGWRNHAHMSQVYWAAKGLVMLLGVGVVGLVLVWVGLAVVLAMISG